jgi:hypothetical protein
MRRDLDKSRLKNQKEFMSSETIILLATIIVTALVNIATLYINKRWSKETADDLKISTALKADALQARTDQQASVIKAPNVEQIQKIDATRDEINGKLQAALAAELARGEVIGIIKGIEIERARTDSHRAEVAVVELAKQIKKDK